MKTSLRDIEDFASLSTSGEDRMEWCKLIYVEVILHYQKSINYKVFPSLLQPLLQRYSNYIHLCFLIIVIIGNGHLSHEKKQVLLSLIPVV